MSLKYFHIFFMTLCILFSLGIGGWSFTRPDTFWLGVGLVLLGVLLVFYTIYFVKKMKKAGVYS